MSRDSAALTVGDWRQELPTLSGSLVSLREPTPHDLGALIDLLSISDASRFSLDEPVSDVDVRAFIDRAIRDRRAGLSFTYAVVQNGTRAVVGVAAAPAARARLLKPRNARALLRLPYAGRESFSRPRGSWDRSRSERSVRAASNCGYSCNTAGRTAPCASWERSRRASCDARFAVAGNTSIRRSGRCSRTTGAITGCPQRRGSIEAARRRAVRTMSELPFRARLYVGAVIFAGVALLAGFAPLATFDRPILFLFLMVLASATAALKVTLPLTTSGSTMSVSYAIDFASLLLLGPHETMLVAAGSAFSQCHLNNKDPEPALSDALQHGLARRHRAGRRASRSSCSPRTVRPIR